MYYNCHGGELESMRKSLDQRLMAMVLGFRVRFVEFRDAVHFFVKCWPQQCPAILVHCDIPGILARHNPEGKTLRRVNWLAHGRPLQVVRMVQEKLNPSE